MLVGVIFHLVEAGSLIVAAVLTGVSTEVLGLQCSLAPG